MIVHLLCFLMTMMFSVVTCAPGQNTARQSMALADDDSKATERVFRVVDPLGGGNLIVSNKREQTKESLASRQENVLNTLMVSAREDKPKQRHMSSHTLDPLGGGHLLKATDPDSETQNFKASELFVDQGRQNMMRLAREDKSSQRSSHALDGLGSGRVVGVVDPYRGNQMFRSLDRNHLLDSLDNYQGGEVLRVLDALTGSDLISSLDSAEGVAVLSALKKTHTKHPKRMLDSVSGWAFGESKRNFDEIDNVGFTGFAKKSPSPYYRKQFEALAKKNFDEIDRAGFETYNKRDFDEIDRTGFETFEKRDRKE